MQNSQGTGGRSEKGPVGWFVGARCKEGEQEAPIRRCAMKTAPLLRGGLRWGIKEGEPNRERTS